MINFKPIYFNCYLFDMDETSLLIYRITYEESQYRYDNYKIQYSKDGGKSWVHDGSYNGLYEAVNGIVHHLYSREKHGKQAYRNIQVDSFEIMELHNKAQEGVGTIAIVGDHPAYDSTNTFDTNEDFSVRLFDILKFREN